MLKMYIKFNINLQFLEKFLVKFKQILRKFKKLYMQIGMHDFDKYNAFGLLYKYVIPLYHV